MSMVAEGLTIRANRLFAQWMTWLNGRRTRSQLALGLLISTVVFVSLTHISGGPSYGDGAETFFPAWAIAHGHLACAFPEETPGSSMVLPFAAPLFPLLTAGLAALFRVGANVAFPSSAQLGPHCGHAIAAITNWSNSVSVEPMIMFGYLGWLALMFGIIALLRSTERGYTGWEPVTLLLVAASPSVLQCVQTYAHPQDMLALGLVLGALASVLRRSWTWAGVLLGLSFTSQQFSVLAIVSLFFALSGASRVKMAAGCLASVTVVSAPLAWFDPPGTLRAVFLGSNRLSVFGREPAKFSGGTILAQLHLHGVALFVIARILPVLLSAIIGWWLSHRLGDQLLQPLPLFSLIATSLCLRLLFEENIFEYYFLAPTVMLLLLNVFRQRWRGYAITWVVATALAFSFSIVAYFSADLIMFIVIAGLIATYIIVETLRRGLHWTFVGLVVLLVATASPTIWGRPMWDQLVPTPVWQVLLTMSSLVLAAEPLVSTWRLRQTPTTTRLSRRASR